MSNRQAQVQQIGEFFLRQKEISAQTWDSFLPQTRILTLFAFIMIIGLVLYTIPFGNPNIPMYIMIVFAFAFLLMVKELPATSSESRLGMLAGVVAGAGIWVAIFYRQVQEENKNRDFGLTELMCKTTDSICPTDGIRGPYNGLQPYLFQPPNKVDDSGTPIRSLNYVPSEFLRSDDPNSFSYCFWMRVSYKDWQRVQGNNMPVLIRANTDSKQACPGVWLDPQSNRVKIEANVSSVSTNVELEYPMDLWVHYAIVLRSITETTLEVYKNGKLVNTRLINAQLVPLNSNLYIASTPEQNTTSSTVDTSTYTRPPIQMVDLVYYNKVLSPEEIQNIYHTQRPMIVAMGPPPSSLSNEPLPPDPSICSSKKTTAQEPKDTTSVTEKTKALFAKAGINISSMESGLSNLLSSSGSTSDSRGGGGSGVFSNLENKWSSWTGSSGSTGGGSDSSGGVISNLENKWSSWTGSGGSTGGSTGGNVTESFSVNEEVMGVDGSVRELFYAW